MRLGSKLSASEAYGRGTCQGIHVMQTLARHQLFTTANAKQRRPLIMLGTMVTPLTTARQPGHMPQCCDEWPLLEHSLSRYVSSIRNIDQRECRPWIRHHGGPDQTPAHRIQVLLLQDIGCKQHAMELHGRGLQYKLSLSSTQSGIEGNAHLPAAEAGTVPRH